MDWRELEIYFNRAVAYTACQKKCGLAFLALSLCGLFSLICQMGARQSGDWVSMGLLVIPILVGSSILLSLGVILTQIHAYEVQNGAVSWREFFIRSLRCAVESFYFSLPSIVVYLVIWMGLGIFYLLRALPGIGDFCGIVFAFGPFLLIFFSLLLCMFNFYLLFFLPPAIAVFPLRKWAILKHAGGFLKKRLLSAVVLFLIGSIPLVVVGGVLYTAIYLSHLRFFIAEGGFSIAIQSLFVMVPFCALLSPVAVFFFNFSMESFWLLQKRASE